MTPNGTAVNYLTSYIGNQTSSDKTLGRKKGESLQLSAASETQLFDFRQTGNSSKADKLTTVSV